MGVIDAITGFLEFLLTHMLRALHSAAADHVIDNYAVFE